LSQIAHKELTQVCTCTNVNTYTSTLIYEIWHLPRNDNFTYRVLPYATEYGWDLRPV